MHLRTEEAAVKTIRHHFTPYVFRFASICVVITPVYFLVFFLGEEILGTWLFWLLAIISFLVGIVVTFVFLDYALDRLILTNQRLIWVNWKSLFRRDEYQVELKEIQHINTQEKGIVSALKIFDYGILEIETAASKTSITFENCPDPEGVKHLLLEELRHPSSVIQV